MAGVAMKLSPRVKVLAGAVALDLLLGEPPAPVHPVVHLGRLITTLERRAPQHGPWRQLTWGAGVAAAVPALAALVGSLAERSLRCAGPAGTLGEAWLLSNAFALRALLAAGESVRRPLAAADLDGARSALRSLVSRDTDGLTSGLIAAAAIESLAENLTDSVVAPWLAYALGGLPAAFAYRTINTLDSMLGYRGRYEYLGKASARLDDLANLIPARLTAVLVASAARAGGGAVRDAAGAARRYHGRTASPNAGWTMAAMAGALRRRLEKSAHYILGDGPEPEPIDIRRAQRIGVASAVLGLAAATALASFASPAGPGSQRMTKR
jgi:adenosylcobinamide-phosphate synthase